MSSRVSESSKELSSIKRKSPHALPLVITVSANQEAALVDFATLNEGSIEAFSSVILTKEIAKNLVSQLSDFIGAKVTYENP